MTARPAKGRSARVVSSPRGRPASWGHDADQPALQPEIARVGEGTLDGTAMDIGGEKSCQAIWMQEEVRQRSEQAGQQPQDEDAPGAEPQERRRED